MGDGPLLLVAEQGHGDTIQFLRYASLLRGCCCVALCPPTNLATLVQASGLVDGIWSSEQAAEHTGPWMPLLSIFSALAASPRRLSVPAPYLSVPRDRIAAWRQRIGSGPEPVIAIHWQGNPDAETGLNAGRSLPLERFASLSRCAPLRLISLQKGHGAEQRFHCSFADRFEACQEAIDRTWDFLETAAILECCDLVISSDSALAHLAGALGRPVWLLLKQVPDWRWGLQGESTPWYPSMRLFRQRRRGDWSELMERVCQALVERSGPPAAGSPSPHAAPIS